MKTEDLLPYDTEAAKDKLGRMWVTHQKINRKHKVGVLLPVWICLREFEDPCAPGQKLKFRIERNGRVSTRNGAFFGVLSMDMAETGGPWEEA